MSKRADIELKAAEIDAALSVLDTLFVEFRSLCYTEDQAYRSAQKPGKLQSQARVHPHPYFEQPDRYLKVALAMYPEVRRLHIKPVPKHSSFYDMVKEFPNSHRPRKK
jgi:hypothetical protein